MYIAINNSNNEWIKSLIDNKEPEWQWIIYIIAFEVYAPLLCNKINLVPT